MDIFKGMESLISMSPRVWARHANPWSVWTRVWGALVIALALWSVWWIGAWAAIPVAAVALWSWVNPRVFAPPRTVDSWATKGVLGERVLLNRRRVAIPAGFRRAAWLTSAVSLAFLLPTLWGLLTRDPALFATGWGGVCVGKLWFVDRMVRLWEVMSTAHPVYRDWGQGRLESGFD